MDIVILRIIAALVGLAILFIIYRKINNWYWKINERIAIGHKTNFLLEKILIQMGASDIDEVTIEETATKNKKKVKIDNWIEFKIKNPNSTGYRTVKDDQAQM